MSVRGRLTELAGAGGLGEVRRVHRGRVSLAASGVAGGGATVAGIGAIILLLNGRWLLALGLVCAAVAVASVYVRFAPVDDAAGREWIGVCDGGLVVYPQHAAPVVLRWDQIEFNQAPAALTYTDPEGARVSRALGAYAGRRDLYRAIVQRQPAPSPVPRRIVVAVAAVVAVGLFGWLVIVPRYTVRTEAALPAEVGDLAVACEGPGTAYPAAAPFTGPAPHPTRFFLVFDSGNASSDSGLPMDDLPATWQQESVSPVQLVACVKQEEQDELVEYCDYVRAGQSTSVPMYRLRYEITLYELRTHRHVDTVTIFGASDCPETALIALGGDNNRVLANATPDQLTAALSRHIG